MIRYGEIALKGKNRRFFENALLQNLKRAVKGLPVIINRTQGRFIASAPEDLQATALDHLSKVFGVVSLSLVTPATLDMEAIKTAAVALATQIAGGLNTFKVITRRPNKNFPLSSPEISRDVGAYLLEQNPGLKVDLHKPAFTIFIEIGAQEAFLYHKNVNGPGGLPVGVSGQALLLLSGGIDSPVAGWMAMKRGLSIGALHFHSYPFTSIRSQEKAIDLCRTINRFGGPMPLHMISLASIQKAIRTNCPEELGIILLRRMMIRLSDKLCRRSGIKALVTGESLGQVASQTLESMEVISAVTRMLILRPLLAMDKREIIDLAQAIETYPVSIRPYEDCCTLFVPRHPVTRPTLSRVNDAETALDIDRLLDESMDSLETRMIEG
jgi:thiamine biosynthesis protein ThiI